MSSDGHFLSFLLTYLGWNEPKGSFPNRESIIGLTQISQFHFFMPVIGPRVGTWSTSGQWNTRMNKLRAFRKVFPFSKGRGISFALIPLLFCFEYCCMQLWILELWQPSCGHEEQYCKYMEADRMQTSDRPRLLMKSVSCKTNFGTAYLWMS